MKSSYSIFKSVLLGVVLVLIVFLSIGYSDLFGKDESKKKVAVEKKSIDEKSLDHMTNFDLGQYYFNHDDDPGGPYDLVKARHYYEQATDEDVRGNSIQWYQLGRIDFIEGNFHTALYRFDKQIEYFGDSVPNVYYMIGLTYGYKARRSGEVGDWEKGAKGFKKYLEFDPQSPWARTDLSWIYFAQGKYEEMIPVLEEGLEYMPEHAWLLNMYGLALMNTGTKEEAKNQFQSAQTAAEKLTFEDWGKAYPGNNPDDWGQGLLEFRAAIDKNIDLAQS